MKANVTPNHMVSVFLHGISKPREDYILCALFNPISPNEIPVFSPLFKWGLHTNQWVGPFVNQCINGAGPYKEIEL